MPTKLAAIAKQIADKIGPVVKMSRRGKVAKYGSSYRTGSEGEYRWEAQVFDQPSGYGINGGRVSKLWIMPKGTKGVSGAVCSFDRGWETKPKEPAVIALAKKIMGMFPGTINAADVDATKKFKRNSTARKYAAANLDHPNIRSVISAHGNAMYVDGYLSQVSSQLQIDPARADRVDSALVKQIAATSAQLKLLVQKLRIMPTKMARPGKPKKYALSCGVTFVRDGSKVQRNFKSESERSEWLKTQKGIQDVKLVKLSRLRSTK